MTAADLEIQNWFVHRRGRKRDTISGKDSTYRQSSRRGGTPWRR